MIYRIVSAPVTKNEEICKDLIYMTKNNLRIKLLDIEAGIFCNVSTILNNVKFTLRSTELYELLVCSDDIQAGDTTIDILTGKMGIAQESKYKHKGQNTFNVDYGVGKPIHRFTNHGHDHLNVGKFVCKLGVGVYSVAECFPEIFKLHIPEDYIDINDGCYCKHSELEDCPFGIKNWCGMNSLKAYFTGAMGKDGDLQMYIINHVLAERAEKNTAAEKNVLVSDDNLEFNPEIKDIFPDNDFNIMYSALDNMDDPHTNMNITELTGELIFRLKKLGYKLTKDEDINHDKYQK